MNKSVFCLLFLVTVLTGQVFAQNEFAPRFSQADKLFNIYPPFVKNIHTAHLRKNEKMIVELADLSDYDMLNHLDS